GGISGYSGAQLVNNATFTLNGQEFQPFGAHTGLARVNTAETPRPKLISYGLIQKTEGTGTVTVQFAFENFGTIEAKTGKSEIQEILPGPASQQYGGAENPPTPAEPHMSCGRPVTCATGNESDTQTDLSVGGRGVGLALTRTYNSQAGAEGAKGPFGYGWT